MTENDSIEIINDKVETCEFYFAEHEHYPKWCEYEFLEALGIAITALKEIQQYREIGTVEEYREAMEKQKLKKPNRSGMDEQDYYICPNCGADIGSIDDYFPRDRYCHECGQAIRWKNLEAMEDE